MEQENTNKLGEVKLVSKYYPVGNYSYPRKDDGTLRNTIRTVNDRASLESQDSEASAPGLVDDKSDSEVSQEDDPQVHAHTTDPFESFWSPDHIDAVHSASEAPHKKQYPALIPCPQHCRQRSESSDGQMSPSWPLPDPAPRERPRKTGASYSAFPRYRLNPPPQVPSKTSVPPRPPRPSHLILTPCLEQPELLPSPFVTTSGLTSPNRLQRPKTSAGASSPSSRHRVTQSLDERPLSIADMDRRKSSGQLPRPQSSIRPQSPTRPQRGPRSYKSTSQLAGHKPAEQSYFDFDDSDSEEPPTTANSKSFFKFHRRSGSDQRHSDKENSKPRHRADTLPVSPTLVQGEQPSNTGKRRQGDVLGRVLGLGRLSR